MCALIGIAPFYDCDEKWLVVVENSLFIKSAYTDQWVAGYAIPKQYVKEYPISKYYSHVKGGDSFKWMVIGSIKQDSCWNEKCLPLFKHEARHLMCNCGWHDNMTSTAKFILKPIDRS